MSQLDIMLQFNQILTVSISLSKNINILMYPSYISPLLFIDMDKTGYTIYKWGE